ncbi:hypothetical protein [Peribacillus frigoritolerans]
MVIWRMGAITREFHVITREFCSFTREFRKFNPIIMKRCKALLSG